MRPGLLPGLAHSICSSPSRVLICSVVLCVCVCAGCVPFCALTFASSLPPPFRSSRTGFRATHCVPVSARNAPHVFVRRELLLLLRVVSPVTRTLHVSLTRQPDVWVVTQQHKSGLGYSHWQKSAALQNSAGLPVCNGILVLRRLRLAPVTRTAFCDLVGGWHRVNLQNGSTGFCALY
jgi:hypothetical protein